MFLSSPAGKIFEETANQPSSDSARAERKLLKGPPIWGASQEFLRFVVGANAGTPIMYKSVHA
jgi:hypothetical protein